MPKASEVAAELRKLADGLDKEPDAEIVRPFVYFSHWGQKEKAAFLSLAKVFPHPFEKKYKEKELELTRTVPGIDLSSRIDRDLVCRIVEPAKPAVYECEPLLSAEEESAIGGAA